MFLLTRIVIADALGFHLVFCYAKQVSRVIFKELGDNPKVFIWNGQGTDDPQQILLQLCAQTQCNEKRFLTLVLKILIQNQILTWDI